MLNWHLHYGTSRSPSLRLDLQLQWISQRDRNPTITYTGRSARCGAEVDRCSDTALGGQGQEDGRDMRLAR